MPAAARLSDKAQVDSDAHGCPACPHPGVGPIVTGSGDVFINGLPAARAQNTDLGVHAICCGPNIFTCKDGSATVYVNNKPLARMNDATKHCGGEGKIIEGSPDVMIDDGADAMGLGSYLMHALQIALAEALAFAKGQAKSHSDSHDGGGDPGGSGGDLASDGTPAGGGPGGAGGGPGGTGGAGGGTAGSGGGTAGSGGGTAGAGGGTGAAGGPAPATTADQVDVQLVNVAGAPQADVEVELTLPDGDKRAGKTDSAGHFRVEGLTVKGKARAEVPDVLVAAPAPASDPSRVRYVAGGVDVPIGKASVVELPPRVRRCRMHGMHFDTDKTFLLPTAMVGIRQLVKLYKSFQGITALVNGHTDVHGTVDHNRGLSVERAESIKAFLLDDVETWMKWYAGRPSSKRWGVLEDQNMLSTVPDKAGRPYLDPPHTTGALDDLTRDAFGRFQSEKMLPVSRGPDPDTRAGLVREYMKLEGTSLDPTSAVEIHGCGQRHLIPGASDSENRRVEVFLFEGKIDPPPRKPCPWEGCKEYDRWVAQKILDVDLDAPPGNATASVVDENNNPVEAHVHLSGPIPLDGKATGGTASFTELVPGDYKAIADAPGFDAAEGAVSVPSGGEGKVILKLKSIGFDLQVLVEDDATPANKLSAAKVSISAPGVLAKDTSADGTVLFEKLPLGTWHLTVARKDFVKNESDVTVGGSAAKAKSSPAAKSALAAKDAAPGPGPAPAPKAPQTARVVLTQRTLIFNFKMLFASAAKPADTRWENRPVAGAKVELIDPIGFMPDITAKTDATGVAKLNVSEWNFGPNDLVVTPPAGSASTAPAGPKTATGAATDPDFMWRPFKAVVTFDKTNVSKVVIDSPPTPAFATLAAIKGFEVTFDWRPDWIKRVKSAATTGGMSFGRPKKPGADGKPTTEDWVDVLVLHQTGAPSRVGNAINTLAFDAGDAAATRINPTTHLPETFKRFATSAHYLVDTDGHVVKIVHEKNTAIHAEPGHWRDIPGPAFNGRSIGIEILHADDSADDVGKMTVYPEAQYTSLLSLLHEIKHDWPLITPQRLVGHCDVDTGANRMGDPGIIFEWHRLQTAGLSRKPDLTVNPTKPYGISSGGVLDAKDKTQVTLLQKDLRTIGYAIGDAAGTVGSATLLAVRKFKRHWFSFTGGSTAAFTFPAPDTKVDFETGKRIIQVVSDGDTPAIVAQTIKSFTAVKVGSAGGTPGTGPDKSAVLVKEGDKVELSWVVEGSPTVLRIEPGNQDVTGKTVDGKGSVVRTIQASDITGDKVIFTLSLDPPAPKSAPLAGESLVEKASLVGTPGILAVPGRLAQAMPLSLLHKIPAARPSGSMTGSAFLADLTTRGLDAPKKDADRDVELVKELIAGNVPPFLLNFVTIPVTFKKFVGEIYVSPDFVAIGDDGDFVRIPLTPVGAQKMHDAFETTFPTSKIADLIFKTTGATILKHHSATDFHPKVPAQDVFDQKNGLMRLNFDVLESNKAIEKDRGTGKLGTLIAGPKKDVILHANALLKDKPLKGQRPVIIYGLNDPPHAWPRQDAGTHHPNTYMDYSHGIRLVAQTMLVDSTLENIFDVARDKDKFGLVTDFFDPSFPKRYP
jgi:N-acetyl-anhydromuramyl-L-alanine amidase AmpD/outer membrane protein OmpA-like peptidoglycan-associated protein